MVDLCTYGAGTLVFAVMDGTVGDSAARARWCAGNLILARDQVAIDAIAAKMWASILSSRTPHVSERRLGVGGSAEDQIVGDTDSRRPRWAKTSGAS
jgi:hypothetical protein